MDTGKASIIIRTKNEGRWITSCLEGILDQTYENWEIVLVDNNSTDKTVEKAKKFPVSEIVTIKDYKPGKALNKGIRASNGEYIVCLSGHCIPVNQSWLASLEKNFNDSNVAGVYGNQKPLSFTPEQDKRDLNIIFGKERIEKEEDDFFHNANSMIRRDIWNTYPFDEELTNLEDRAWAQTVLDAGYKTVYEPKASVYHYHGIHHNGDKERAQNHIRVLNELSDDNASQPHRAPDQVTTVSLIPKKGSPQYIDDQPLIAHTIHQSINCHSVDRTIVTTDNDETAKIAEEYGAEVPFIRKPSLSEEHVDLQTVYQYTLEQLEAAELYPDVLVMLEPTYPFRPSNLIENMVIKYLREGLDTLVAGYSESKPIFQENDKEEVELIHEGIVPRKYQDRTYIGIRGLGCVVSPSVIRNGNIYGKKSAIYRVESSLSRIEVREQADIELSTPIKEGLADLDSNWDKHQYNVLYHPRG